MGKDRVRLCQQCNAVIPNGWDTDEHMGTCPSCKRLVNFVLKDEELRSIEEDNKKKQDEELEIHQKRMLLETYDVMDETKGGMRYVHCANLAKLIISESSFNFHTIEDIDTGKQEIFYYEDGLYKRGGENRIKELVNYYLDSLSTINRRNEVVDFIRHKGHDFRDELEPPLNLVNLKNGVYDIDTGKLLPHSPDYYFIQQLPVLYDDKAKCPVIEKFFNDVLYKEDVLIMQEIFGYLLYREYPFHKAFLFYGGGRNGKGITVELMTNFLGRNNYATRNLHELVEDKFAKSSLYGKLANFGAEIDGRALKSTGDFKNLTGGESITGERKFYGAYNFRNYAKLVFNANQMPYSQYDKTLAFFQRWKIMVFPETFEPEDKKTDPFILKKLITQDEISGLFNWAIVGLNRLLKNYCFTKNEKENEEYVGEWFEMLVYPEKRYITEHLELSKDLYIEKNEVYDKYETWARRHGYTVITITSFTRSMKKLYDKETKLGCETGRVRSGDKRLQVYKNVAWKYISESEDNNQRDIDFFNPVNLIVEPREDKERRILDGLEDG